MSSFKKAASEKFTGLTQCWNNLINDFKTKKQNMLAGENHKFSHINTTAAFELLEPRILLSAAAPVDSDSDGWYEITKAEHLVAISDHWYNSDWMDRSYVVMNDIDFYDMDGDGFNIAANETGVDWDCDGTVGDADDLKGFDPIGYYTNDFTGNFDGGGYTIKNLWVNNDVSNAGGLFRYIKANDNDTVISNFSLVDADVTYNVFNLGGIVGTVNSDVDGIGDVYFNNCSYSGKLSSNANSVGGLIGCAYTNENSGVYVDNCEFNGSIIGLNDNQSVDYGGIIGKSYGNGKSIVIENSTSVGSITGNIYRSGGLVAYGKNVQIIASQTNMEIVSNNSYAGGIVGYLLANSSIINSNANSQIISSGYSGGICGGISESLILASSAVVDITSNGTCIGGIVGLIQMNSAITEVYVMGTINLTSSESKNAGGIVGQASDSAINNVYSKVDITSSNNLGRLGGIFGYGWSLSVNNSYAEGSIANVENSGGISGYDSSSVKIENCYWNAITTGQSTGTPAGAGEEHNEVGYFDLLGFDESIWNTDTDDNIPALNNSNGVAGLSLIRNSITEGLNAVVILENTVEGSIFTDPDYSELSVINSGIHRLRYGTLTINADGTYSYSLDDTNEDVDGLNSGDSLADNFVFSIDNEGDIALALLQISIAGVDDEYVAKDDSVEIFYLPNNDDTGGETERISGNVLDNDLYNNVTVTNAGSITGNYGTLVIAEDGNYTYVLNRSSGDVAGLSSEAALSDIFVITADGKSQNLEITIQTPGTINNLIEFSTWAQSGLFNDYCPSFLNSNGELIRGLTGCTATALAQLLVYYEAPAVFSFDFTDYFSINGDRYYYTDETANLFDMPTAEELTATVNNINYEAILSVTMSSQYSASESISNDIAYLSLAAGIMTHMNYKDSSSSALLYENNLLEQFGDYFTCDCIVPENASTTGEVDVVLTPEEKQIIISSLVAGDPLYFSVWNDNNNGHAIILTGYDTATDYFYFNMGWGGTQDDFYELTDISTSYHFNSLQKYFGNFEMPSGDQLIRTEVVDDTASLDTGEQLIKTSGNILSNDTAQYNEDMYVYNSGVFYGEYGSVKLNADGSFVYTLNADNIAIQELKGSETLEDSFVYLMKDAAGIHNSTLSITIIGNNDDPTVSGDIDNSGNEDNTITGTLVANDVDSSGSFEWSVTTDPSYGTVSIDENGAYSYTPAGDWNGSDSFVVTLSDGDGGSTTQTVNIVVAAVNDDPTVTGDVSKNGNEDNAITGTLVANDVDTGSVFSWSVTTDPSHGTVSIDENGAYSYTPAGDWNGSDSFVVRLSDGDGGSTTQTVNIVVAAVNDDPTVTGDVSKNGNEDNAITGTLVANDVDTGSVFSWSVTTDPSHGNVTINESGEYSYTPAGDWNGSDSFIVTLSDGDGGSTTQTVNIVVAAVNDDPTVTGDVSKNGNEDNAITGTLVANDVDTGSVFSWSVTTDPSHGTVSIDENGAYSYTPAGDWNGSDSFVVRLSDGDGGSTTQTVNIVVAAVNDDPTVTGDVSKNGNEDNAITGTLVANDVDTGSVFSWSVTTDPSHGNVTINESGEYSYTPAGDWNGSDSFIVTLSDGDGGSTTQTVNIVVAAVNDDPTVTGDVSKNGNEDNAITGTLVANDVDTGSVFSWSVTTDPSHGTVSIDENGAYSYTPAGDWNGSDSFVVRLSDGDGGSTTQTVNIVVAAVNDDPTVTGDVSKNGNEDNAITGTLVANDVDTGSVFSWSVTTDPSHGNVTINESGEYSYTPAGDWNGSDSFIVTLSDGDGGSTTQTVNIVVAAVNDDPTVTGDVSKNGNEDNAITGTLVANDVDTGSVFSWSVTTDPSHGTVSIDENGAYSYTPAGDWNGSDSFVVRLSDGDGGSTTQTVNIVVAAVNDDPTVTGDVSKNGNEDNAITGTLVANDVDTGSVFSWSVTTDPSHGTVSIDENGAYSYTPAGDWNGSDSFVVTLSDGDGGSTTQTVNIVVAAVNDDPTISGASSNSGNEDTAITGTLVANDVDTGSVFSWSVTTDPSHGTVSIDENGAYSYTPAGDWNGSDSFVVTLSDGDGGSTTQTVNIVVAAVNDDPTISGASSNSGNEDTAITGTLVANDVDTGSVFSWSVTTDPSHGTVSIDENGAYSYTPAGDWNGSDSFVVTLSDGDGGSTTQTVNIVVAAVNDDPTISGASSNSGNEDNTITGTLVANDVDTGSVFSWSVTTDPSHGTVSIDENGAYSYTPAGDWNGSDSFVVTLSDGAGGSTTQTVNISVAAVNDDPTISGDINGTVKQDYTLVGELTASDIDSSGVTYTWSIDSNPTHGSIDIDQGGVYLYTPTAGWSGSDSFTVMVTGSDGGTVSQTISITVSSYVAPSSSVAGGFVYYSNMDGAADDPRSAVAVNKHAYTGVGDLSESIISSTNGITGVIVDIKGDGNYTLADFDIKVGTGGDVTGWQSYEAAGIGVPTITVKSGEGVGGSDRVLLTWDSSNAPKNTWLQVTAKTSAGISHNSSQIFGSIAGDIDESGSVNINDIITLLPMCNRILSNLTISNYDTNNSGSVNINDIISLLPLVNRPVALTAPDLSGMSMTQDGLFTELESAENLADDLNQIVYIDVDGERGFIFNSPIALSGITTDAFSLSGQFSGQEDSMLERVLDNLNSSDYALHGVEFTFDRPLSGDYSTIFVGGDDDTFEIFGDLYGISENVDTDNLVKNDNAIVFSDELGLEQYNDLDTASSVLTEVIEHEVGHLLGLKHA